MNDNRLALMDQGEANNRILSKDEHRADFRRVEAASLKRRTCLASGEGKRIFARCFYSFQANMYVVSQFGRTKLPHEYIEQVEADVRSKLEKATKEINQAIDASDEQLKKHSIDAVATYDTVPLAAEVGLTSALGRRYFELIHKLDQLMPILQTLQIEEVISEKQEEVQRSHYKRIVVAMASSARNFAVGCRKRMNEADAKREEQEAKKGRPTAERAGLGQNAEGAAPDAPVDGTGALTDSAPAGGPEPVAVEAH